MQMNHHAGAMMSPNMPPHGMPRPDGGAMMKGQQGMPPGMDAIARYNYFFCLNFYARLNSLIHFEMNYDTNTRT